MSSTSLTGHLPTIKTACPYDNATKHPFLTAAGEGTLPLPRLALWLAQDRLYAAHGYPRFIGRLIAAIPYSSEHATISKEEKQNARTLEVLVYCLQNVVREVGFFDDLGSVHGFNVNGWKERKGTRDYLAEMARVSSEGELFDGLVFLWAMEKVYLDSWRHVDALTRMKGSAVAPIRELTKNWVSDDFVRFLNDIAELVDAYDVRPGSERWKRAELIWERVVELEEAFWPLEGEETVLAI
ncbi:heme oxygenase-like protein [Peniophora sp. CONT]|nr:heme oxygenase-like protein [Peniophora sp. CONT]